MRRGAASVALALSLTCLPAEAAEPLFVDVTPGSGIPALRYGEGVNAVDLDGDGLPELFLACVRGRDRLLRNRGNIHRDLDQMIADMNTLVRFDLHLLDAVRILTGNGPQGGRLADVRRRDTLIASADPVAADSLGATLFGIAGRDVPHVAHAARLGLGEIDLERVQVRARDLAAG